MNTFLNARLKLALIRVIRVTVFVLLAFQGFASPLPPRFFTALHAVETSGQTGAVIGDAGAALGPYQIHRSYWKDARVNGRYEQCADEPYARRVVTAYLTRYAPVAVKSGDWQTLARIHNGGPQGDQKAATLGYWKSVERELNHRWTQMDTDRKDNFRADWGKSESELNKPQQLLKSHALIISQRTPMVAHHLAQVARPGSATLPGLLSLGVPAQGHAITAGVGFTGGRRRNPSRLDHTGHPESVLKRTAPPANPKNSPVRRALARTSPAMSPAIATTPVSCRLVCTGLIPHASRPLKRPGFSGDNFGNAEVSHRSGPVAT